LEPFSSTVCKEIISKESIVSVYSIGKNRNEVILVYQKGLVSIMSFSKEDYFIKKESLNVVGMGLFKEKLKHLNTK
jgi:hypothetical protein